MAVDRPPGEKLAPAARIRTLLAQGYTAAMARAAKRAKAGECRQCATYCDRVIRPATCIQNGCRFLYEYDEPLTGRRYMGCLQKVFATEIDVELFRQAERSRGGFGAVKLSREPLEPCQFTVEQAFDGAGAEAYRCVNRRFFDWPDTSADAVRAFDLRDRL
jgi:hypothetical protein